MRLFRRRTEFRGLALFALAVQLVLSFGHVHTDGTALGRAVSASTALACRTITRPAADQNCPQRSPADTTACAICWTIAQAGSVVLDEPPAVPPPSPVAATLRLDRPQAVVGEIETASFEARGPPSPRA